MLINIGLLLVFLIAMNWIYTKCFYKKDLQQYSNFVEKSWEMTADSCDIVYIGESSNQMVGDTDQDKRRISEFVAGYYPKLRLGDITRPAAHAEIYYYLLSSIPEPSSVKTVVVTMNLRSFGADWIYSKLETPLQKEIVLLKHYPPLYDRFLLGFKGYDIKTDAERMEEVHYHWKHDSLNFPYHFKYSNTADWDKGMAYQGIKDKDGNFSQSLTELACHYIKSYGFQIRDDNPRLKDFDAIVQLAHERGWNLVFNIMAENVDRANELVGGDLIFLMKRNRDFLINRYRNQMGVVVVDNMNAVRNEQFIDQNWTTEHYYEDGRRIIARNVAFALKQFYPNAFVDCSINMSNPCHYRNECESPNNWSQTYTITSEQHFSGSCSSKVYDKWPYSLTFEKKTGEICQGKSKIRISMQVFSKQINDRSSLVIELDKEGEVPVSFRFPVSDYYETSGNWDFIDLTLPIDDSFYKADLVKIYVHNPTEMPLYVDDINIEFE